MANATILAATPLGQRPVDRSRQRGNRDPDDGAAAPADQRIVTLRQHDIDQRQEDRRGIDRQARQRALGNERRIVIEREEHVRRPRRNRQRRHQRADHRAGALGDHGCRHHERGRDRHAQRERQDEDEFGGHFSYRRPGGEGAGTHEPRAYRGGVKAVQSALSEARDRHPTPARSTWTTLPLKGRVTTTLTPAASTPKPSGRS